MNNNFGNIPTPTYSVIADWVKIPPHIPPDRELGPIPTIETSGTVVPPLNHHRPTSSSVPPVSRPIPAAPLPPMRQSYKRPRSESPDIDAMNELIADYEEHHDYDHSKEGSNHVDDNIPLDEPEFTASKHEQVLKAASLTEKSSTLASNDSLSSTNISFGSPDSTKKLNALKNAIHVLGDAGVRMEVIDILRKEVLIEMGIDSPGPIVVPPVMIKNSPPQPPLNIPRSEPAIKSAISDLSRPNISTAPPPMTKPIAAAPLPPSRPVPPKPNLAPSHPPSISSARLMHNSSTAYASETEPESDPDNALPIPATSSVYIGTVSGNSVSNNKAISLVSPVSSSPISSTPVASGSAVVPAPPPRPLSSFSHVPSSSSSVPPPPILARPTLQPRGSLLGSSVEVLDLEESETLGYIAEGADDTRFHETELRRILEWAGSLLLTPSDCSLLSHANFDVSSGFSAANARGSPPNAKSAGLWRRANAYLTSVFGIPSFRGIQALCVANALAGQDCFALMPTGGGKSLCYQLPAVATGGLTVVVSPLLALMRDQVIQMRLLGVRADLISSDERNGIGGTVWQDIDAIRFFKRKNKERANGADSGDEDVEDNSLKLLYVTPENLTKSGKIADILTGLYSDGALDRFVVDEAHCVSTWGIDFRPDYKDLGIIRRKWPRVPIMALTATATARVFADIVKVLGLAPMLDVDVERLQMQRTVKQQGISVFSVDSSGGNRFSFSGGSGSSSAIRASGTAAPPPCSYLRVFRNSFNRRNLEYHLEETSSSTARAIELIKAALLLPRKADGSYDWSAIVYVATQRESESLVNKINEAFGVYSKTERERGKGKSSPSSGGGFSRKKSSGGALGRMGDRELIATYYHGGMADKEEKNENQERWMNGSVPVMVATTAFGMGINKPNVRFVIHTSLPKSVTSYYQESGRAGRDGLPSKCYLFWSWSDLSTLERFAQSSPTAEARKYNFLEMHRMLMLALQPECRRRGILRHFNEVVSPRLCAFTCDVCQRDRDHYLVPVDCTVEAVMLLLSVLYAERRGPSQALTPKQLLDSVMTRPSSIARRQSSSIPDSSGKKKKSDPKNEFLLTLPCAALAHYSSPLLEAVTSGTGQKSRSSKKSTAVTLPATPLGEPTYDDVLADAISSRDARLGGRETPQRACNSSLSGFEALQYYCKRSVSEVDVRRLVYSLVASRVLDQQSIQGGVSFGGSGPVSNVRFFVGPEGHRLLSAVGLAGADPAGVSVSQVHALVSGQTALNSHSTGVQAPITAYGFGSGRSSLPAADLCVVVLFEHANLYGSGPASCANASLADSRGASVPLTPSASNSTNVSTSTTNPPTTSNPNSDASLNANKANPINSTSTTSHYVNSTSSSHSLNISSNPTSAASSGNRPPPPLPPPRMSANPARIPPPLVAPKPTNVDLEMALRALEAAESSQLGSSIPGSGTNLGSTTVGNTTTTVIAPNTAKGSAAMPELVTGNNYFDQFLGHPNSPLNISAWVLGQRSAALHRGLADAAAELRASASSTPHWLSSHGWGGSGKEVPILTNPPRVVFPQVLLEAAARTAPSSLAQVRSLPGFNDLVVRSATNGKSPEKINSGESLQNQCSLFSQPAATAAGADTTGGTIYGDSDSERTDSLPSSPELRASDSGSLRVTSEVVNLDSTSEDELPSTLNVSDVSREGRTDSIYRRASGRVVTSEEALELSALLILRAVEQAGLRCPDAEAWLSAFSEFIIASEKKHSRYAFLGQRVAHLQLQQQQAQQMQQRGLEEQLATLRNNREAIRKELEHDRILGALELSIDIFDSIKM